MWYEVQKVQEGKAGFVLPGKEVEACGNGEQMQHETCVRGVSEVIARTGVEVKTPSPRKARASKPARPWSKAVCAAGPPSG